MKPIPIFPVIGGYTTGLLFNSFGVSSHIQMTIQILLMGIQACVIFCSFLRKHQSIVTIDKKFELEKLTDWGIIVFVHIEMLIFTLLFYSARVSKEDQKAYIRKNIPNLEEELSKCPSLEIYDREVN
ncbi:Protein CBG26945 [Caenorhabditis briggsae]|uniref:Protein CBG26945 n=1 Tax=Caenorhabditis briggsae TaxID=6238 RepID=B6IHT8_CAEBR|nr:Protein CBG26945 [Caenorhabditis briggsae]CAR99468.1 Protein CBG26945 [Caenorhabditis briggsae]